jgi:hypothetical protein
VARIGQEPGPIGILVDAAGLPRTAKEVEPGAPAVGPDAVGHPSGSCAIAPRAEQREYVRPPVTGPGLR